MKSSTDSAIVLLLMRVLHSLAASPSPPNWSSGHAAKQNAQGGEGLSNIALDHVCLECQLNVPVNR